MGKTRPKRADARHNAERIVDAARISLMRDPSASMIEIAQEAGVGRVTLYGHFSSREAVIEAALTRAMEEGDTVLEALDLTGDAGEALGSLIESSWLLTAQSAALLEAAREALPDGRVQELHAKPARRIEDLLQRGRREGVFRTDQPISWMSGVLHHLMKGAATEVAAGRLDQATVGTLLRETVLSAYAVPPHHRSRRGGTDRVRLAEGQRAPSCTGRKGSCPE